MPNFLTHIFISFSAGALSVTAFAPLEWWPVILVTLACLFYLLRNTTPKQSFYVGLAFGYGLFGVGVSWVYVSLHVYGGMPLWMGSIAVLGFAGILAVFCGLTGYVTARLLPQGSSLRLLVLPLVWVVFEWLKSWILTGFAWLEIGSTQTPSWLLGLAPIGGIYLVSFVVAAVASLIVLLLTKRSILAGGALLLIAFVAWGANQIRWSTPYGKELVVGVVQGNVDINQKWQTAHRQQVIDTLASLSHELNQQQPHDLIVWPETALPVFQQQTNPVFWRSLVPGNTALLTGIMDSPSSDKSYNAAALICNGKQSMYRKRHLVPFGEYLPLRFLFSWVLEYLDLPMSDFSKWQGQQSMQCGDDIKLGLSICYEDAFASEMRDYVGDATLLVNISEDAWFGDSFAPHQRLQMGQMRARELARPMVRSANTGPSALVNELGQVLARTEQFKVQKLTHRVQPQTGETPYKRFGNWVIWLSLAVLAFFLVRLRNR